MTYAIKISIYRQLWVLGLASTFSWSQPVIGLEGQKTFVPASRTGSPQRVVDAGGIQRANQNYKDCTSQATAAVKAGKLRLEDLPVEFGRCTDRFPAAGLFQECKKNLLKSAKGSEINVNDVNRCKAVLTAASFDPTEPAPVFIAGSQAVFAGVGLNRSVKLSSMQIPNYNCGKLQAAFTDIPRNAQHILFGNHPKMFLNGTDQPKYLTSLGAFSSKNSKQAKYLDVPGFGRLFGDPRKDQSIVYFPSASCEFEAATGQIFAGINLFYLLDSKNRVSTPYFGIAYYRQGQKSITTPELVAEVSRRLGPNFKAYSKDAQTVFISATPFKEVDNERDPRNICELPRPHRMVAVVHTFKGSPNAPEYLLLANIRNLCDYGDLQARGLVR